MKRRILIVEDNVGLSQMQKDWFAQAGYDAVTAISEPIARSLIRKTTFDMILSDVRLPEGNGISLLEWIRREKKDIPFIITTEYVSVPDVVRTIKLGAIDYLPKPVHREHLLELAEDVFKPMVTVRKKEKVMFHRTSPLILQVQKNVRLVASSEMAVMILGANGTGKESVAQSIHQGSERWNKPFVAVNCGALPRELAASLLFGHEKEHLPVQIPPRLVISIWRKAEHYFWMKSEQCLMKFKPCFSVCCKKVPIHQSAAVRNE